MSVRCSGDRTQPARMQSAQMVEADGPVQAAGAGSTHRSIIVFLRIVHGLIAAALIASVGAIYYAVVTETHGTWLYTALAALLLEGIVVMLNKGNCPSGHVSRRYGDSKPFFELFLPPRIAKQMFKVNFVILLMGCLLLPIRLVI
jgi:hypothetical protein